MKKAEKTRAEEIAYDMGVKDGLAGNDKCPYLTAQYAQCWREGYAHGKAETGAVNDRT